MSQSLSRLYVHMVFHVKNNIIKIRKEDDQRLYAYIGTILNDNASIPIIINGVEDHIHILCIMSKNIALSKLFEEVKKHSSRWIKTIHPHYKNFRWQGGYAAFSVSHYNAEVLKKYIQNQKEHHKPISFREEYLKLLNEHDVAFDERYLWKD